MAESRGGSGGHRVHGADCDDFFAESEAVADGGKRGVTERPRSDGLFGVGRGAGAAARHRGGPQVRRRRGAGAQLDDPEAEDAVRDLEVVVQLLEQRGRPAELDQVVVGLARACAPRRPSWRLPQSWRPTISPARSIASSTLARIVSRRSCSIVVIEQQDQVVDRGFGGHAAAHASSAGRTGRHRRLPRMGLDVLRRVRWRNVSARRHGRGRRGRRGGVAAPAPPRAAAAREGAKPLGEPSMPVGPEGLPSRGDRRGVAGDARSAAVGAGGRTPASRRRAGLTRADDRNGRMRRAVRMAGGARSGGTARRGAG